MTRVLDILLGCIIGSVIMIVVVAFAPIIEEDNTMELQKQIDQLEMENSAVWDVNKKMLDKLK